MLTVQLVIKECQPEDLIQKVVQFNYRGGSETGLRTIRVEKTFKIRSAWYLEGYDLSKPDLHEDAYRRYCLNKVCGEIRVLN